MFILMEKISLLLLLFICIVKILETEEGAVDTVCSLFRDPGQITRRHTSMALANLALALSHTNDASLGSSMSNTIPILIELSSTEDKYVKMCCIRALNHLSSANEKLVDDMILNGAMDACFSFLKFEEMTADIETDPDEKETKIEPPLEEEFSMLDLELGHNNDMHMKEEALGVLANFSCRSSSWKPLVATYDIVHKVGSMLKAQSVVTEDDDEDPEKIRREKMQFCYACSMVLSNICTSIPMMEIIVEHGIISLLVQMAKMFSLLSTTPSDKDTNTKSEHPSDLDITQLLAKPSGAGDISDDFQLNILSALLKLASSPCSHDKLFVQGGVSLLLSKAQCIFEGEEDSQASNIDSQKRVAVRALCELCKNKEINSKLLDKGIVKLLQFIVQSSSTSHENLTVSCVSALAKVTQNGGISPALITICGEVLGIVEKWTGMAENTITMRTASCFVQDCAALLHNICTTNVVNLSATKCKSLAVLPKYVSRILASRDHIASRGAADDEGGTCVRGRCSHSLLHMSMANRNHLELNPVDMRNELRSTSTDVTKKVGFLAWLHHNTNTQQHVY
jgi:hypothetical protein